MRQSAFALVGDLSRVCAPHLQPVMKQLLALAIQNMESHCISLQNMSACNNACWSMGTHILLPLLHSQDALVHILLLLVHVCDVLMRIMLLLVHGLCSSDSVRHMLFCLSL